jgi:hypothetical protein
MSRGAHWLKKGREEGDGLKLSQNAIIIIIIIIILRRGTKYGLDKFNFCVYEYFTFKSKVRSRYDQVRFPP